MACHISYIKILLTQLSGINTKIDADVKVVLIINNIFSFDKYSSLVSALLNILDQNLSNVEASLPEAVKKVIRKITSGTNFEGAFY